MTMTGTDIVDLSKLKIPHKDNTSSGDKPPKRFGILMYIIGAVFLGLAVFFFFKDNFSSKEVVELTVVTSISPNQASAVLTASGYVVAQRKASIASKATGRLIYLGFEEGDRVRKGDIIGRIESADMEAALNQAKANLEVNKAELNDARQSLERVNKLFESHLASQAEVDAAQWRYDRVIASIKSTEAAVEAAQVQLENTLIRAPFNGTILTKNADVGEVVTPFAAGASSRVAVVTIADMTSLEVEADVSESNIEKIYVNQPCEIILDAYPDYRYKGYVNKIVPTADRAKATVLTKIRFSGRDDRVLPEMSAKVYFLSMKVVDSSQSNPITAVDFSAITTSRGKKIVFLLRNDTVEETVVELGKQVGNMIQITDGLTVGDKVVNNPSKTLYSGKKIKIGQ